MSEPSPVGWPDLYAQVQRLRKHLYRHVHWRHPRQAELAAISLRFFLVDRLLVVDLTRPVDQAKTVSARQLLFSPAVMRSSYLGLDASSLPPGGPRLPARFEPVGWQSENQAADCWVGTESTTGERTCNDSRL